MKDVMSIKELAEYIGMSKSKIYQLIKSKKIPASKIGRQYKFSKDVIDEWLKEKIITEESEIQGTLFTKPILNEGNSIPDHNKGN